MKPIAESQQTKTCKHVSCKSGLKQGVLLPLLLNFAFECAMRRVQADQKGLKLIGTHQLLFHNDLNVFGASICTIKENTEASVFVSNQIGIDGGMILKWIFKKWGGRH